MLSTITRLLLFSASLSHASQLSHIRNTLNIQDINIPQLNFSNNDNEIQILGNVEGLSFYKYQGQQNFTGPIASETDSRGLIYYSSDTLIRLASSSNDTEINKIVPVGSDSFILSGSGYLNGYPLANQLFFNLSNLQINRIFDVEIPSVQTILVDDQIVYFGGNFTYSNGTTDGHSVVAWNYIKNSTELLPFVGFGENSTVNSIIKIDEGNILFVGKFNTLDDTSLLSYNSSNSSNTENSSSTFSKQNATSFQLEQQIPLKYATWTSQDSQFNLDTFACSDGSTESWLHQGSTGEITCNLAYSTNLSKIRIYNSNNKDNEVSTFRIVTSPSNSIMNMTYLDPSTGEIKYCDAFCPLYRIEQLDTAYSNETSSTSMISLLNNNTTDIQWSSTFQEFAFVNQIDVSSIQFIALESYGENVGLSGFQLYQNSFTSFANNSFNEPNCGSTSSFSSVLSDNEWKQGLSSESYISTNYTSGLGSIPSVEFYPNIENMGNYTINIYTPGCTDDGSCQSRGIVNVTLWNGNSNTIISSQLIYQNNNAMKYDPIFVGYLTSTPKITLEYYSGIIDNTSPVIVVADKVELIPKYLELESLNSNRIENGSLNGLFQYQLANFTSNNKNSLPKVTNTSLNQYAVSNFPAEVSLYGATYNSTLLLGGSVSGIRELQLINDLHIKSTHIIATDGNVTGIGSYSEGVVFLGNFNFSSGVVCSLSYNGTFNSFGNTGSSITMLTNITFNGSELLIFDNEYAFNVSSETYISNTTSFSESVWAAGSNSNGDTLFSGIVSRFEYSDFNGSTNIFGNGSAGSLVFNGNKQPYLGVYLNESLSGYIYEDNDKSKIIFSDGTIGKWDLPSNITTLYYSDNKTLLAGGSSQYSSDSQFFILNLTNMEVIANETLSSNSQLTSIVEFSGNSTLLVGGDFTISGAYCTGICLFDYKNKAWSRFGNQTIEGVVSNIEFSAKYGLLISGLFATKNMTSVSLASINLTNYWLSELNWGSKKFINSFDSSNETIIAWNRTDIIKYDSESWSTIAIPNSNSSTVIDKVEFVSQSNNSVSSSNNLLLVYGKIYSTEYGNLEAMLYNFESWTPYFLTAPSNENNLQLGNIFSNRDVSNIYYSQVVLQNPNTTVSNPNPHKTKQKHSKIDRGLVVLIGLALAIGTVAILGLFGVLVAYIFREGIGEYEPIKPRIDENEMIDTVPPEKLMKFI